MTTPLLDFAARPQSYPRCLVLAESDRARTGSSVAVLLRDPSTASPYWPLALAAYRRIWSGYKAHAPVVSATALLTQVADTLAAEPELLERPDLVAAFATVEGGELAAWGLATALVLVRQGEELIELGPSGFNAVPAADAIARGAERSGLWHGRLEVGAGAAVCLLERATAARLGWWRLRHALGAASGEEILAELGLAEDVAVAGRVVRSPIPAGALAPSLESRFVASPPEVGVPAQAALPPQTPPVEEHTAEPQFMLRSGRKHRGERQLSWIADPDRVRAPAQEAAPTASSDLDLSSRDLDPFGASLEEAEARSAAGTSFPLGREQHPASVEPEPKAESAVAAGANTGLLLSGRRTRRHGREARFEEPGHSLVSWITSALDEWGMSRGSTPGGVERTAIRRAMAWTVLGVSAIGVVALLILVGRFLTGPRPEGDELTAIGMTEGASPSAERASNAGDGKEQPPAIPFNGASWTHRFPQAITSSPLVHGEHLIVGCRDGNVYGLALEDGSERWRLAAGSGIGSSPAAAGRLAVVGTYGGDVIALDAESGREHWRTATGGKVVSSPAVHAKMGILAVGSHDQHIYGMAIKDGTVRWKVKTGGIVWASPTIAGKRVIVGSYDGALYCLDGESGRLEWRAEVGGAISSTAAVWHDRVVVGSADRQVSAYSLADGKLLWSHRTGSPVGGPVVAAGDLVLAGTDSGELVALAGADGSRRYRVRTGGAIKSRPAVSEGRVWFTSYDGRLRVVDLASGRDLWSFPAAGNLYSSPALLGRTAFFGSMNGTLYAATWAVGRDES